MRAVPLSVLVVLSGTVILAVGIGTRLGFGLFLQPMSEALGWGRGTFAFAIALQNILWGLSQPFTGMLADRFGASRVVAVGGLGYGAGLILMAHSDTPWLLNLSAGVLIGLSLSASSFAVVLGAVGRAVTERRRSLALGIAAAGGSLGQLIMLPVSHGLIAWTGWTAALTWLGIIALSIVPLAFVLRGNAAGASGAGLPQSMGQALREAGRHRGYWLLTGGFFVCGFHVTFIGTHLPAYIVDHALAPGLGALALAVIGGFNVLGSYFWGAMGGWHSKKNNLAALYLIRAVVITGLLVFPVTQLTILVFAAAMGFLWLGTVQLTSALVGQMFGMRYLSTLFGIVFLSHQVGAFLGVWLGGWVYDRTGSYDTVWYVAIALGLVSALLHWPIDERPVERLAAVPAPAGAEASY